MIFKSPVMPGAIFSPNVFNLQQSTSTVYIKYSKKSCVIFKWPIMTEIN